MTIASSGEEQRKMGTFYCVYFGLFKNILVGPGPSGSMLKLEVCRRAGGSGLKEGTIL
jgi:hypothetical protein